MTFADTRPILDQLGYTIRYVQLPGETLHEPPVEGALRMVPADGVRTPSRSRSSTTAPPVVSRRPAARTTRSRCSVGS